jgi:hypothetical protein
VAGLTIAALLVASQEQFAPSRFEYGHPSDHTGLLLTAPVPLLIAPQKTYLLSGQGKRGVGETLAPFNGRYITLHATLASHGRNDMLEVIPGQVQVSADAAGIPERAPLGRVSLTGEIVDSKCYFGVMNPGAGKVHRDCAVRCISGGLPPALLVRYAQGTLQVVMLTASRGVDLSKGLLPFVAQPVKISGDLFRFADRVFLETDLGGLRRE